MKILLVSSFPPQLGGLETMAALVARQWSRQPSLEVKVATTVLGPVDPDLPFELHRAPTLARLHQLYQWADAIFFNHCYLKLALPLLWHRRSYVISMSGMMSAVIPSSMGGRLKKKLLMQLIRRADANIAACQAVRLGNGVPAEVIPNPYDKDIYYRDDSVPRCWDFFYGGRVNQETKGCYDLINAFIACRQRTGLNLTLSVAGDGPGLGKMKELAEAAGIMENVRFLGVLAGTSLAHEMRQHRIIVVPSRYQEPIGIVCLEGIACGCLAIGSSGGGLAESVGPCGLTFPNGDVEALTRCMAELVTASETQTRSMQQAAAAHLRQYWPEVVASRYLSTLEKACGKSPLL